jgi:hypothetical protein
MLTKTKPPRNGLLVEEDAVTEPGLFRLHRLAAVASPCPPLWLVQVPGNAGDSKEREQQQDGSDDAHCVSTARRSGDGNDPDCCAPLPKRLCAVRRSPGPSRTREPLGVMLRLMVMRSVVLILGACLLAGCTSETKVTPDSLAVCRTALPSQKVVSAQPDSVKDFRQFSYGPGSFPSGGPLASAFPEASPEDSGVWCWTENQPLRSYTAWAVVDGRAERGYTANGQYASPPSGRPVGG